MEDKVAMVAGWGAMRPEGRERPVQLQAVDVKVVDNDRCEEWHKGNGIKVKVYTSIFRSYNVGSAVGLKQFSQ